MQRCDYLAIPYVLVLESSVDADGRWTRSASYPELGCTARAGTPLEAIELLERRRIRHIKELVAAGQPVPTPRRPLRNSNGWSERTAAELMGAELMEPAEPIDPPN
jgi:hypothetical protein